MAVKKDNARLRQDLEDASAKLVVSAINCIPLALFLMEGVALFMFLIFQVAEKGKGTITPNGLINTSLPVTFPAKNIPISAGWYSSFISLVPQFSLRLLSYLNTCFLRFGRR